MVKNCLCSYFKMRCPKCGLKSGRYVSYSNTKEGEPSYPMGYRDAMYVYIPEMTITVSYAICDKCGHIWDEKEQEENTGGGWVNI